MAFIAGLTRQETTPQRAHPSPTAFRECAASSQAPGSSFCAWTAYLLRFYILAAARFDICAAFILHKVRWIVVNRHLKRQHRCLS